MLDFTRLYVEGDDCWKAFVKIFEKHLFEDGTRKRNSPINFLAHLIAGLIAYTKLPKKPSLKIQNIKYQPKEFLYLNA